MALDTETLIVGASAAGLATAVRLRSLGQVFEIIENEDAVAGAWRRHYDRLHLHTPKSTSSLPGLAMPAEWERYPSRERVVEYLERYQGYFGLRPHFSQTVTRIERIGDAWETTTSTGSWRTRNVVVATGRARIPVRPTWPGLDGFVGAVLHSSEYRNAGPWDGRAVLVVGFGNSACEIALDLIEGGAVAHLSVRSPVNVVPRDLFGLIPVLQLAIMMRSLPSQVTDALAWPLIRVTVGDVRDIGLRKLAYGPITQIVRHGQVPLLDIGTMEQIKAGRIIAHGGIDHFVEDGVVFADASEVAVDAVVLGTGYRPGLDRFLVDWEAVCDPSGFPLLSGRPSGLHGLYFCGMAVSPAGMLREIGLEAGRIAAAIAGGRRQRRLRVAKAGWMGRRDQITSRPRDT